MVFEIKVRYAQASGLRLWRALALAGSGSGGLWLWRVQALAGFWLWRVLALAGFWLWRGSGSGGALGLEGLSARTGTGAGVEVWVRDGLRFEFGVGAEVEVGVEVGVGVGGEVGGEIWVGGEVGFCLFRSCAGDGGARRGADRGLRPRP